MLFRRRNNFSCGYKFLDFVLPSHCSFAPHASIWETTWRPKKKWWKYPTNDSILFPTILRAISAFFSRLTSIEMRFLIFISQRIFRSEPLYEKHKTQVCMTTIDSWCTERCYESIFPKIWQPWKQINSAKKNLSYIAFQLAILPWSNLLSFFSSIIRNIFNLDAILSNHITSLFVIFFHL